MGVKLSWESGDGQVGTGVLTPTDDSSAASANRKPAVVVAELDGRLLTWEDLEGFRLIASGPRTAAAEALIQRAKSAGFEIAWGESAEKKSESPKEPTESVTGA